MKSQDEERRSYRVTLDNAGHCQSSRESFEGRVSVTVDFEVGPPPKLWTRLRNATRTWWRMVRGYRYIVFADFSAIPLPWQRGTPWLRVEWAQPGSADDEPLTAG